eukprot:1145625-Pelagomonas_calceolata.AAC.12
MVEGAMLWLGMHSLHMSSPLLFPSLPEDLVRVRHISVVQSWHITSLQPFWAYMIDPMGMASMHTIQSFLARARAGGCLRRLCKMQNGEDGEACG